MNKDTLKTFFGTLLDILRIDALTGEKALRNMSYVLTLKLLEPQFGPDKLNVDNTDFYPALVATEPEEVVQKILASSRFSSLAEENEENLSNITRYVWEYVLSEHPATKNIFLANKKFDIKHHSTFKKLFEKANSVNLNDCDVDVLGNAYEEVIKDIMTGKVLGQFFTQPAIKRLMVHLVQPKIFSDGTFETCCDPTMGTGGFLLTFLKHLTALSKQQNIPLNQEFLRKEGLYGKEIDDETFQLACSNMLISTGLVFENLHNGDSLRDPIEKKFDCILANPPYGLKGLNYDNIRSTYRNQYVPIRTTNAVCLFLQAIICMLKVNGRCAVVLPDGKELITKKTAALIHVREYLLRTCDLKEVIYLPNKVFDYTAIKTCVFYFEKKKNGDEVIEVALDGKNCNFINDEFATNAVSFYTSEFTEDRENVCKSFLGSLTMDEIQQNQFSLNFSEYKKKEEDDKKRKLRELSSSKKTEFLTLKDICKFLPKSKRSAKHGKPEGLYPFFKSSNEVTSFVDEPDFQKESIIIGDGGEANVNFGTRFSTSDHCYVLQNNKEDKVFLPYVYTYLKENLELLGRLFTGVGIKNISKTKIESIVIPVPSLEKQREIVNKIQSLKIEFGEKIAQLENEIAENKIMLQSQTAEAFILDIKEEDEDEDEDIEEEEDNVEPDEKKSKITSEDDLDNVENEIIS